MRQRRRMYRRPAPEGAGGLDKAAGRGAQGHGPGHPGVLRPAREDEGQAEAPEALAGHGDDDQAEDQGGKGEKAVGQAHEQAVQQGRDGAGQAHGQADQGHAEAHGQGQPQGRADAVEDAAGHAAPQAVRAQEEVRARRGQAQGQVLGLGIVGREHRGEEPAAEKRQDQRRAQDQAGVARREPQRRPGPERRREARRRGGYGDRLRHGGCPQPG